MDRGINELFEGPTITDGTDKYLLTPSSFAEAEIGLMSKSEVRKGLEEVLKEATINPAFEAPSIRAAICLIEKRLGRSVCLEDVLERVRAHHENSSALITKQPIKQAELSGGGVWHYTIRRRGNEKKERERAVTIKLDSSGNIMQYMCQCQTFRYNTAKGNYDTISEQQQNGAALSGVAVPMLDVSGFPTFNVMVACYHVAASLIHISRTTGQYRVPFAFTNVSVLEALFMDAFGGIKEATIDDYLIRSGALTQETIVQISEGNLTLEVVKHMKNIDKRAQEIINGIKRAREREVYAFSGFATDFRGTPFQTASIILTKNDGRSVHILYDSRLRIKAPFSRPENGAELPLIMLNIPIFTWMSEGRTPPVSEMAELTGDPMVSTRGYFRGFDGRTQQEVVSIIARPDGHLLTPLERRTYEQVFESRRPKRQARQALN
ncbi:hypothetical protein HYV85_04630 [Candidatus Woesearchaeota archaeon]|nr:hypothetical protein [Candidatus Woesearchaeota archaeon]